MLPLKLGHTLLPAAVRKAFLEVKRAHLLSSPEHIVHLMLTLDSVKTQMLLSLPFHCCTCIRTGMRILAIRTDKLCMYASWCQCCTHYIWLLCLAPQSLQSEQAWGACHAGNTKALWRLGIIQELSQGCGFHNSTCNWCDIQERM